jgi:hypothetical protein
VLNLVVRWWWERTFILILIKWRTLNKKLTDN